MAFFATCTYTKAHRIGSVNVVMYGPLCSNSLRLKNSSALQTDSFRYFRFNARQVNRIGCLYQFAWPSLLTACKCNRSSGSVPIVHTNAKMAPSLLVLNPWSPTFFHPHEDATESVPVTGKLLKRLLAKLQPLAVAFHCKLNFARLKEELFKAIFT